MIWNKSNRTYQNAFLCKVFDCVPPGAIFYYKYNNHCSSALSRVWTNVIFPELSHDTDSLLCSRAMITISQILHCKVFKTYRYISMFLLCRRLWWECGDISKVRGNICFIAPPLDFNQKLFPVNYARISCRLPLSTTL